MKLIQHSRAAALLLAGALAACSDDVVTPTASADLSTDDLRAVLVAEGYRADMIHTKYLN